MITTEPKKNCPICQSAGSELYSKLNDRLFKASGDWFISKCNNSKCDAIWLNPMPTNDTIKYAYSEYYTHQDLNGSRLSKIKLMYNRVRHSYISQKFSYICYDGIFIKFLGFMLNFFPRRTSEIDLEVFHLPAMNDGKLLEIGCGSGEKLQMMKSLGWDVQGIDFDPEAVKNAKLKGLDVKVGALTDFNFESKKFDAIVMSHVIEHVHNPITLIDECKRILADGGRLVLITPNTESIGHKLFKSNWMPLDPPRHLILFNARNLTGIIERLGFSDVSCKSSIRDANGVFATSTQIYLKGYGKMGPHRGLLSFYGKIMQLIEWVVLLFKSNSGEEIVVIAKK